MITTQKTERMLEALEVRLNTILPQEYQDCYEDV